MLTEPIRFMLDDPQHKHHLTIMMFNWFSVMGFLSSMARIIDHDPEECNKQLKEWLNSAFKISMAHYDIKGDKQLLNVIKELEIMGLEGGKVTTISEIENLIKDMEQGS